MPDNPILLRTSQRLNTSRDRVDATRRLCAGSAETMRFSRELIERSRNRMRRAQFGVRALIP